MGREGSSGGCAGAPPPGIPTSTGLSALRQGTDRPLGGFHGCIHEVRINNELQDFKALPPQSLGVSPGCKSCTVCKHGLCRSVEKDSVVCECHSGWTGPLCDQEARDPCLGHRSVSREPRLPAWIQSLPLPLPHPRSGTDKSWRKCGQTVHRSCLRGQELTQPNSRSHLETSVCEDLAENTSLCQVTLWNLSRATAHTYMTLGRCSPMSIWLGKWTEGEFQPQLLHLGDMDKTVFYIEAAEER